MGTLAVKSKIQRSRKDQDSRSSLIKSSGRKRVFKKLDTLFLPYQKEFILDDTQLVIVEKCRQSGFSTAQAFRSTMLAMMGIKSTYYSTYNLPACANFISRVARMAKAINYGVKLTTGQDVFDDNSISSMSIHFPNGLFVKAIPGDAKNYRDRTDSELVIDEAAFRLGGLDEVLKAAMANLLWGVGSIRIISTHNGQDNDFNKECRRIEADPNIGNLHKITFRDALNQGLYRQICSISNDTWTQEKETEWCDNWYKRYGSGASEELDVVPRKGGSGKYFNESFFHQVTIDDYTIATAIKLISWDIAATDRDKNKNAYYTAYLEAVFIDNQIIVTDMDAEQFGAIQANDWIVNRSKACFPDTLVLIEKQPGAAGNFYTEKVQNSLIDRAVIDYEPKAAKDVRAMPLAGALKGRQIVFSDKIPEKKFDRYVKAMGDFDGRKKPLTSDYCDATSQLYDYCYENFASWLSEI